MIVAIMSSETMEWYSLGRDEKEAKEAILHSWNKNQISLVKSGWKNEAETFADVEKMEKEYDIEIIKLNPGECIFK